MLRVDILQHFGHTYLILAILAQSLGCLLFALCFYKSPFDYIHEKGDSVALAVVSERINFPSESPYPEVSYLLFTETYYLLENYTKIPFNFSD